MSINLQKKYKNIEDAIKAITPAQIKQIRKSYNLSQSGFAYLLDISVRTLQNYEIGHRIPSSVGTALFKLAQENPKIFLKRLDYDSRAFVR